MKNLILSFAFLASGMLAAPIALTPSNGQLSGTPGSTVGWSFSLTPDPTRWISAITSILLTESNPALGVYTDNIGALGGPVNFATPPGGGNWVDQVGSFAIASNAAPGSVNLGTLRISVEYFTGDPFTCGSCADGAEDFDFAYRITVAQPTNGEIPEPATFALCGIATVLGLLLKKGGR